MAYGLSLFTVAPKLKNDILEFIIRGQLSRYLYLGGKKSLQTVITFILLLIMCTDCVYSAPS